jgi:hypothetical protein
MNTEKLNQHLFSKVTRVYALIDGAAIPELRSKLYEMKPPHFCLFTGDLAADMAEVAPYLVRLIPQTPFAAWTVEQFRDKNRGVFVHSRQTVEQMRSHFRSLVTVYDERGNPLTFRFYDPRVLREYLPTCNAAELKVFFGEVESYFAETGDEGMRQFENADGSLKQIELDIS